MSILARLITKSFLVTLVIISSIAIPGSRAYASGDALPETEQETQIKDVKGLRLQLVQHTQNPYNREVQFDLIIYPQFSSDRLQVSWLVTGAGALVTEAKQVLAVEPGQLYFRSAKIRPSKLGSITVLAKVEAFQADGTYLSTASKVLGSYDSGEIFPVTNDYRIAQVLFYIQVAATWILLILLAIIGAYTLYQRWRKWVGRDEPTSTF